MQEQSKDKVVYSLSSAQPFNQFFFHRYLLLASLDSCGDVFHNYLVCVKVFTFIFKKIFCIPAGSGSYIVEK